MKKITSLFLALIMLCITPLTTIAYAQQLDEYGGVVVYVPLDMELLEKKFREYVKNAAAYYYDQADQGASFSYSKYYYEAADLKAAFDSEKNIWGGNTQENLAYNTQENISKRNYEQETREITLYMLSQDVQNKADQLKALTPEQKAAFSPGVMFDPITGDVILNEQANIAQEMYAAELNEKLEEGTAQTITLGVDVLFDIGFGVAGISAKEAYSAVDTVRSLVTKIWQYDIQLKYEEEKKELKNAYRAAMIADVVAMQSNIDDQMFEGLNDLYDELVAKEAADTNSQILVESLEQLLDAVEQSQSIAHVSSIAVNGTTISEEIERIAEELVNEAGMTEEELRAENELALLRLEYGLTEAILAAANYLFSLIEEADTSGQSSTVVSDLYEKVKPFVRSAVKEFITDLKNDALDLKSGSLYDDNGAKLLESIGEKGLEKFVEGVSIFKWARQIENGANAQAVLDEIHEFFGSHPEVELDIDSYEKTLKDTQKKTRKADSAKENLEKKNYKAAWFEALVSDGIELAKISWDAALAGISIGNEFDSEVMVSVVASAMYRARELAEEERANVLLNYAHLANPDNIDHADLSDLKAFLDSMYVVLNTDMLGQSYYATLAGYYENQTDPEMDKKRQEEVDAYFDAMTENAWNSGPGGKVAMISAWTWAGIAWYPSYWWMKLGVVGDSEYLKKVDKESKLGSWLSSDSAVSKYNTLAEIVSSAYEFPALFEPLFK